MASLLNQPQFRTLTYILDKVRSHFGQSDPRLEATIVPDLTDRMREICAMYPFWFLVGFPDIISFPRLTSEDGWIARGWYICAAGEQSFNLQTMVDGSTTSAMRANVEAKTIEYCKVYDLQGALLSDLNVAHPDLFGSDALLQSTTSQQLRGVPMSCMPITELAVTKLVLNPVPDAQYVLQICWQYATIPWFSYNNDVTNLLLMHYPRVVEALVGELYAKFFKQPDAIAYFEKMLMGDAGGNVVSGQKDPGLIATMKRDTMNRFSQNTDEVEWRHSARDAVGRRVNYGRGVWDPYYYGPTPYA